MGELIMKLVLDLTTTRRDYRNFIQNLRAHLGERFSHNRPALPVQENPPTRFFELILRTNDHSVWFRLRMDNLYLIGYRMESGQWLEFDNENDQHLITEPGTSFLGFDGSYRQLQRAAGGDWRLRDMRVGFHNLVFATNQLAVSTSGESRARSLIVVIMMICESIRFIPVSDYMASNFDSSDGITREGEPLIQQWIIDLVHTWGSLSAALLRADAYPEQSFQLRENNIRLPPNNREIRTIAQAAEILGILLGLCFTRSGPRRFPIMNSDEGQCFLGLPLLQVFSVRINNINNENPGELYGTITINNGLYTQYIYNRTRDNFEYIRPGQNATLTGPSESVSAFWNFTIKLLLTDKDVISWDDVIINQDISWDAANIGNVYDKLIPQPLYSSMGSVTVNYAVLRNAVAAKVTFTLEKGGESTVEVYGQVSAQYDNWEDPDTTCLLFNSPRDNYVSVNRWETIPLLRSVVAVPLSTPLKVTARLWDYDPISADDEIAIGTVEFPVPEKIPTTSRDGISGESGNWVTVTVNWSSVF